MIYRAVTLYALKMISEYFIGSIASTVTVVKVVSTSSLTLLWPSSPLSLFVSVCYPPGVLISSHSLRVMNIW